MFTFGKGQFIHWVAMEDLLNFTDDQYAHFFNTLALKFGYTLD